MSSPMDNPEFAKFVRIREVDDGLMNKNVKLEINITGKTEGQTKFVIENAPTCLLSLIHVVVGRRLSGKD